MIFIKKLLLLSAVVATVVSAYIVTSNGVLAADTTNPHDTLIQKIATKFGLSVADVQTVFDEQRKEMESEKKAKQEQRLTTLVSERKITEAQKQLILQKMNELFSDRSQNKESMKDKTPGERKALMDSHKAEMETWAKDNGIDPKYLFGGFGKGGMKFRMMNK